MSLQDGPSSSGTHGRPFAPSSRPTSLAREPGPSECEPRAPRPTGRCPGLSFWRVRVSTAPTSGLGTPAAHAKQQARLGAGAETQGGSPSQPGAPPCAGRGEGSARSLDPPSRKTEPPATPRAMKSGAWSVRFAFHVIVTVTARGKPRCLGPQDPPLPTALAPSCSSPPSGTGLRGDLGLWLRFSHWSARAIMCSFYSAPRILTALFVFPLICGISSKWA